MCPEIDGLDMKTLMVEFYEVYCLKVTRGSAIITDFLSFVASFDTFVNSILAISASFNHRNGSGVAKSAKSTLAFAIKNSVVSFEVIFAGFALVGGARDTFFSVTSVASYGHGDEASGNNGLRKAIIN